MGRKQRNAMIGRALGALSIGIAVVALAIDLARDAVTPAAAEAHAGALVRAYGPGLVPYATVRRNDGTYRRMLVTPEALSTAKSGSAAGGA